MKRVLTTLIVVALALPAVAQTVPPTYVTTPVSWTGGGTTAFGDAANWGGVLPFPVNGAYGVGTNNQIRLGDQPGQVVNVVLSDGLTYDLGNASLSGYEVLETTYAAGTTPTPTQAEKDALLIWPTRHRIGMNGATVNFSLTSGTIEVNTRNSLDFGFTGGTTNVIMDGGSVIAKAYEGSDLVAISNTAGTVRNGSTGTGSITFGNDMQFQYGQVPVENVTTHLEMKSGLLQGPMVLGRNGTFTMNMTGGEIKGYVAEENPLRDSTWVRNPWQQIQVGYSGTTTITQSGGVISSGELLIGRSYDAYPYGTTNYVGAVTRYTMTGGEIKVRATLHIGSDGRGLPNATFLQDGGRIQIGMPGTGYTSVPSLIVGNAGTAVWELTDKAQVYLAYGSDGHATTKQANFSIGNGDTSNATVITHGASFTQDPVIKTVFTVRSGTKAGAKGTLRGWGNIAFKGDFNMNGRVIADGEGVERSLDFSTMSSVISGSNFASNAAQNDVTYPLYVNTTDNGWFAINKGKVILPAVAITVGSGRNFTFGEYYGDTDIDMVNSVRFTNVKVVTSAMTVSSSLLASNRSDITLPTGLAAGRTIGVWDFATSGGTIDTVVLPNAVFRYDEVAAANASILESQLKLYHFDGTNWNEVAATVDTTKKQISVTGLTGGLGMFAIGLPALNGDADGNGAVDFADYLTLESNYGKSGDASWKNADFNADGAVDFADYLTLEANYGSGTAVPEPATLALLTLGGLALIRRRK